MTSLRCRLTFLLPYLIVIQVCLGSTNTAEKVSLDLYYESLCPYSANFIINELPVIFDNGIIDIVDLRLFPWGNARLISNNSFICQHGPMECLFNSIEACAIDAWPNLDDHFQFINCVETQIYEGKYAQWETCFEKLGLDPKPVTSCYKTGQGNKLELEYAAITSALDPPHEYVPWVVVDGEPLYEDYENFVSYVCKAYKGTPPSVCNKASFASVAGKKSSHIHRVSYIDQTIHIPFLMKFWSFVASWVAPMMQNLL